MSAPGQPQPYPGDVGGPVAAAMDPAGVAPAVAPLEAPEPYPGDVGDTVTAALVSDRPLPPQPYGGDVAGGGSTTLQKVYADALGRPMTGRVAITGLAPEVRGRAAIAGGGVGIMPGARLVVELTEGRLDLALPPGEYTLEAQLRTADGNRLTDTDTVTLGG